MDFSECVQACFQDRELVSCFDKLRGTNLSMRGTGLEVEIDFGSGRMNHDCELFVQFVRECVWERIWVKK
jgi:hypothetical protein